MNFCSPKKTILHAKDFCGKISCFLTSTFGIYNLTYIIIYATSLASMEAALSVGRSLSSPLTRTIWHATSKILPTCICSILFETFCKCNAFVLNGI